jgi:glycerol-3-phosphate acyltransferase PlsX
MSSDEIGGAPLLGVQGAVIKAHGSSNDYAFCSAIGQCIKMIDGKVVQAIEEGVAKMLQE